jgi:hypothetical protein
MDALTRLKNLEERARQREQQRREQTTEAKEQKIALTSTKVVKLPVETKEQRAAPNVCLRSALFSVVKPGRRKYWPINNLISIFAQDSYKVLYGGEQLNQSDLDIWLAIKFLCMPYPLGTEVRFTAPDLFRVLGWQDGKRSRETVQRSLRRLADGYLEARDDKRGFGGHLIDWWAWDKNAYQFCVILSPKMAPLFGSDSYTLLDIEQCRMLSKELSRWLHSYWSSHEQIYPIYDATLIKLCGAEVQEIRKFRQLLREALTELESATFLRSGWTVDRNGLVKAAKAPAVKALRQTFRKLHKTAKKRGR